MGDVKAKEVAIETEAVVDPEVAARKSHKEKETKDRVAQGRRTSRSGTIMRSRPRTSHEIRGSPKADNQRFDNRSCKIRPRRYQNKYRNDGRLEIIQSIQYHLSNALSGQ